MKHMTVFIFCCAESGIVHHKSWPQNMCHTHSWPQHRPKTHKCIFNKTHKSVYYLSQKCFFSVFLLKHFFLCVDFLNLQMPFWSFHSFTALMHKYFQWWMREDNLLDGTFFHQEIWWINSSFTNPLLKDLPSPAVPSHLLSWHSRICTSRGLRTPYLLVWTLVNNDTKMIISFQICLEGNGFGFQRIYSSTLPHRLHSPVTGNGHTLSRQMQWNWNAMDLKCDSECFY